MTPPSRLRSLTLPLLSLCLLLFLLLPLIRLFFVPFFPESKNFRRFDGRGDTGDVTNFTTLCVEDVVRTSEQPIMRFPSLLLSICSYTRMNVDDFERHVIVHMTYRFKSKYICHLRIPVLGTEKSAISPLLYTVLTKSNQDKVLLLGPVLPINFCSLQVRKVSFNNTGTLHQYCIQYTLPNIIV